MTEPAATPPHSGGSAPAVGRSFRVRWRHRPQPRLSSQARRLPHLRAARRSAARARRHPDVSGAGYRPRCGESRDPGRADGRRLPGGRGHLRIAWRRRKSRDSTTAAAIWLAAVLGLAAGAGQFFIAFVGAGMGLLLLSAGGSFERLVFGKKKKRNSSQDDEPPT